MPTPPAAPAAEPRWIPQAVSRRMCPNAVRRLLDSPHRPSVRTLVQTGTLTAAQVLASGAITSPRALRWLRQRALAETVRVQPGRSR